MKLTLRLIENLKKLLMGESIPYSALPASLTRSLTAEGLVNIEYHGSRRCLRTHNADALSGALPRYNEALRDLEMAHFLIEKIVHVHSRHRYPEIQRRATSVLVQDSS